MKNWKTTLVGLVGAILTVVAAQMTTGVDIVTIIQAAVVAAVGYLAKDFGVSGTGQ